MQNEQTINKWIRELQKIAQSDPTTLETRIAYLEWHLLRRVVEDVVDWPSVTDDLKETVALIQREIDNGEYRDMEPR